MADKNKTPVTENIFPFFVVVAHTVTIDISRHGNNRHQWYGHVSRSSGLEKTALQGTEGSKKTRKTKEVVGRQRQRVGMIRLSGVTEGCGRRTEMEAAGCEIIGGAPTTLRVKGHHYRDRRHSKAGRVLCNIHSLHCVLRSFCSTEMVSNKI